MIQINPYYFINLFPAYCLLDWLDSGYQAKFWKIPKFSPKIIICIKFVVHLKLKYFLTDSKKLQWKKVLSFNLVLLAKFPFNSFAKITVCKERLNETVPYFHPIIQNNWSTCNFIDCSNCLHCRIKVFCPNILCPFLKMWRLLISNHLLFNSFLPIFVFCLQTFFWSNYFVQ